MIKLKKYQEEKKTLQSLKNIIQEYKENKKPLCTIYNGIKEETFNNKHPLSSEVLK